MHPILKMLIIEVCIIITLAAGLVGLIAFGVGLALESIGFPM